MIAHRSWRVVSCPLRSARSLVHELIAPSCGRSTCMARPLSRGRVSPPGRARGHPHDSPDARPCRRHQADAAVPDHHGRRTVESDDLCVGAPTSVEGGRSVRLKPDTTSSAPTDCPLIVHGPFEKCAPGRTRTCDPRLRRMQKGDSQGQRYAAAPRFHWCSGKCQTTGNHSEFLRVVTHLSPGYRSCYQQRLGIPTAAISSNQDADARARSRRSGCDRVRHDRRR